MGCASRAESYCSKEIRVDGEIFSKLLPVVSSGGRVIGGLSVCALITPEFSKVLWAAWEP